MKIDRMQNKTKRRLSFLFALLLVSSALTSPLIIHDVKADSGSSPIGVSARPSDAGIGKTPEPAAADDQKISQNDNHDLSDTSERLSYQVYVTPDDPTIQGLAAQKTAPLKPTL